VAATRVDLSEHDHISDYRNASANAALIVGPESYPYFLATKRSANVIARKVTKTIAVTFGLFAIVYVGWLFYASLVLHPNEANTSLLGFVMLALLTFLLVSTIAMSRSVWLRSSARPTSSRLFWVCTPFMVIFSMAVSPFSPTMLIFVIIAIVLLFLNLALGRSVDPILAE
jgi:hypothetical protein